MHLDTKEIPSGNIMSRWLKDDPQLANNAALSTRPDISGASADMLKKRVLLKRAIDVVYGKNELNEEAFAQAMGAMDSVVCPGMSSRNTSADMIKTQENDHQKKCVQGNDAPSLGNHESISCPDRTRKNGRPSHSSLKSWKEQQKRMNRDSNVEENTGGRKTRRLADVLGSK